MSPLVIVIIVSLISFLLNGISWFLAGRRQHYVHHLDIKRSMLIVFLEDLAPYLAIGGLLLVPTILDKAIVALSGAVGGAIGVGLAIMIEKRRLKKEKQNDKF